MSYFVQSKAFGITIMLLSWSEFFLLSFHLFYKEMGKKIVQGLPLFFCHLKLRTVTIC